MVNLNKLGIGDLESSIQGFSQLVLKPDYTPSSVSAGIFTSLPGEVMYDKGIGIPLVGRGAYDPSSRERIANQFVDKAVKPVFPPSIQVNQEVIFDEKGGQRLGRFIYGMVSLNFSGPVIQELDNLNETEIQQRKALLDEAKQIIETVVKLPKSVKWLPGLYLDNLEAFGELPDGKALDIYAYFYKRPGVVIRVYDPTVPRLFKSYDDTARDLLIQMNKENRIRIGQGKQPVPATAELTKIGQETDRH